jgi:antitoxin (DNA-binding transcriptional repressor) of toxin-antitoxin stability system
MSHRIDIRQAAGQLQELVLSLKEGDEIILMQGDVPVGRVTGPRTDERLRGAWKGKVTILDDSDDGVAELFKEYMP